MAVRETHQGNGGENLGKQWAGVPAWGRGRGHSFVNNYYPQAALSHCRW